MLFAIFSLMCFCPPSLLGWLYEVLWASTMTAVKNTTQVKNKGGFSTTAFLETQEHFPGGYGQASPSLFAFFRF